MRYYPIAIDTQNKKVLIIGGGRASYLKLKSLLDTYAQITVISESFSRDIVDARNNHNTKLTLITEKIDKDNINIPSTYDIVFICTDDKELNRHLCRYFKVQNIMVMAADDRKNSDFITSSIIEKKNITISVNTDGRSPTVSKLIAEEIRNILTEEFVNKIDMFCEMRDLLRSQKTDSQNEMNIKSLMDEMIKYDVEKIKSKILEIKSTGDSNEDNSRYKRQ